MDTLLSGSTTALFLPPLPPLRTFTPTSTSSSVSASSTSSCFLGFSRNQRRISSSSSSSRRPLQWCSTSSSYPCTVPKCTITCGAIREINESEFSASVLKADRPVLVEFVANWCGPCRLIAPAIEWVAQEYGDRLTVVKIDHDANPRLIEEYKVYGLPALILFKDGQEVPESRREGAITKAKLKDYLDTLLASISVA